MFEKSLYDLIRGLRNHKGNEREYIQGSLRECRQEIKGQDMDLKATAVLKLTYLEMFGHDMSWASFNILEVMSSPKYTQKRVGYLGAVQSFRPDTEVLMLAENLLKKDLMSPQIPNISLPLVAIPHVINPAMANSLLSELLPRLTHSSPFVRKKTIVTLYRLALVYPETLRPAWPKIKERLADDNEDPSVTAAVVNVVCELGWRRPQDFLALAPRLFTLLVETKNNWMAIKIIKLFATLTPLEPRLVNKLLPPITDIINTTPAMSLLYECINGIIQGGILQNAQGTARGDEMARLCVTKLRGMLVAEGDPNLKYVALMAFNRIVELHPHLVTMHEDVVMECIDDLDISIRLQALDLAVGMVNPQNLVPIVDRLLRQLRDAPLLSSADDPQNNRADVTGIVPMAEYDGSDPEIALRPAQDRSNQPPPLPNDYRRTVIQRILNMCARNTYANVNDFDWYIDVLVQLVRCVPPVDRVEDLVDGQSSYHIEENDIAYEVGRELQNVAIRVKSSRAEATHAAESLVSIQRRAKLFPASGNGGTGVLEAAVWVVGEFASFTLDASDTLDSLLHFSTTHLPAVTLAAYLQAIIKLFAHLTGNEQQSWTQETRTSASLLITKVTQFLEPLVTSPDLEVQERAVEYLELVRLAGEAIDSQEPSSDYSVYTHPPFLLTQAIPALFSESEINPVAKDAQRKVTLQEGLDLEKPINENLSTMLLQVPTLDTSGYNDDEFDDYYTKRPQPQTVVAEPAAKRLADFEISYQQNDSNLLDSELSAKRRIDRIERNRDDPFYIPSQTTSGRGTPLQSTLKTKNGEDFDVDSIPIMELDLDANDASQAGIRSAAGSAATRTRRNFEILGDETIGDSNEQMSSIPRNGAEGTKSKKSVLQVDSSGLGSLSLGGSTTPAARLEVEQRAAEDAEMAAAMKEVERLRLQMQRDAERVEAANGQAEEVVVKRKKKKKKPTSEPTVAEDGQAAGEQTGEATTKEKKTQASVESGANAPEGGADDDAGPVQPKKKKKKKKPREVVLNEDVEAAS